MELVDVSSAVLSYMGLLTQNFQRTGENGRIFLRLLANSTIKDYAVGTEDYRILKDRILDIFQSVPMLDKTAVLRATGRRGTYGSIYMDKSDPNIIYKVIDLPTDEIGGLEKMHSFLKETFIQHLINTDPELGKHAPKVFGIYKNMPSGMPTSVTIKMSKSNITLYDRIQKKVPAVRFDWLAPNLIEVIKVLVKLHTKYHFTHRDFKSDNIMYKENVPQFIDYGMACIHFRAFGAEYNVMNNVYYTSRSKCRIEQDISLLLLKLQIDFGSFFDERLKQFMADIGMPRFIGILNGIKAAKNTEAGLLGKKAVLFHMAYNRNNTLMKRPDVGPNFTPEFVLSKLGVIVGSRTALAPTRVNVPVVPTRVNVPVVPSRVNVPVSDRMSFLPPRFLPPAMQPPTRANIPVRRINLTNKRQALPTRVNAPPTRVNAPRLNNTRKKGYLIGTQGSPTDYAIIPLRRAQA
jgi:serine/threonine protein kinase